MIKGECKMYKKIIGMTLCFLILLSATPLSVMASPRTVNNAYIDNAYFNMLQDAFDDVSLANGLARGLSDNLNYEPKMTPMYLNYLLSPVYEVIDSIVYSIDIDNLSNNDILIRDVAQHYFFENIHLEIRTEGEFIFATLSYSVYFETESDKEETFSAGVARSTSFNRLRSGSQRIFDLHHPSINSGTAHASNRYFIRDDQTVHIDASTNSFWGQIHDARLLRSIVSVGFTIHNNGTRNPHTSNNYRAYFQPSGTMQTGFRISW